MEIRRIEDRCTLCMKCVKDCVASVWRDVNGIPTPVDVTLCNLCSHCVAVCPVNAVYHSKLDADQVRPINKDLIMAEAYSEIVLARRSIRQYRKTPVPKETIEKIIDIARYSPTASNQQNVAYTVITDEALLKNISKRVFGHGIKANAALKKPAGKVLMGAIKNTDFGKTMGKYMEVFDFYAEKSSEGRDFILHGAPAVIAISAPQKASFAVDNCNLSAANITNYACAMGLGTCHIGFITWASKYDKTLRSWFNLPKGHRIFSTLILGYPAVTHNLTTSRKKAPINWIG